MPLIKNVVDETAVQLAVSSVLTRSNMVKETVSSSDPHLVLWAVCLQCPPFSPSQDMQLTVHSSTGGVAYTAMISHHKLSSFFPFMS